MADKPNDSSNERSSSVPEITLDLVPEAKSSEVPQPKVDNITVDYSSRKESFKFTAASPLFRSVGSPSTLKTFSFGSGMSGTKPSTSSAASPLRASFLRPPQLASPEKFGSIPDFGESSTSKCSFALKPARLSNPFAKASESEENADESEVTPSHVKPQEPATQSSQPSSSLPKFVPLGTPLPPSQQRVSHAPPAAPPAPSTSAASGFVFGQNLHERVSDVSSTESSSEKKEPLEPANNGAPSGSKMLESNGTTENLFTSVLKREQVEKNNDSGGEGGSDRPSKSLSEAAKEYEESRAVKRKYEEVAVVTGEEDELNILQINCKLFAFDKIKSSWVERGRGNLRLNDKESGSGQKQSRVIMRATGSFRVVLNTKLWPGMVVEKVSTKSVRLTAMDAVSGEIMVFLVMASPKDADFLYNYLESRVASLKASCAENASSYPDASRKTNTSSNASESDASENTPGKKRATESSQEEINTNHSVKLASNSKDAQDTGGSDDSCLGKNAGDGVTNSTALS